VGLFYLPKMWYYLKVNINEILMATKDRRSQINCIIFKKESNDYKFLLLKRREDRGGFWQAITGGVKGGETDTEAVKRELQEETGITNYTRLINLDYCYSFSLPQYGDLVENCYAIEISPETEIVMSPEHTEYKWLSLDEAIGLLKYEANREAFRKIYKILEKEKV